MRQGAVGEVRLVLREGRRLVEKRLRDPARYDTELRALRALEGSGLPVPQVIDAHPGMIVMTELPGTRLDDVGPESRLAGCATRRLFFADCTRSRLRRASRPHPTMPRSWPATAPPADRACP